MQKKEIKSTIYEYSSEKELEKEDAILINHAKKSAVKAYAPYSKFKVGVSLLLENGQFINGSNQENIAYPSGLCAERVAVYYANSEFPKVPVKSIAITAFTKNSFTGEPIYPCGSCLQALIETELRFGKPIKVIMYGEKKIQVAESVGQLLPLHFGRAII